MKPVKIACTYFSFITQLIDPNSSLHYQRGLIKTYEGLVFIIIACFIFWMFVRIIA